MNRLLTTILGTTLWLVGLSSCRDSNSTELSKRSHMPSPTPRTLAMFENKTTVCIGRFLVDVPRTAEIVYGPAYVHYPIDRYPGQGGLLDERVVARLSAIEDEREYAFGPLAREDSMLGKVKDGRILGQRLVFGVNKASGVFYDIDSFTKVGDDLFIQRARAFADQPRFSETIRYLNSVAGNLRPRGPFEIPSGPGICIDGAFVVEPGEPVYERVTLGIRFKEAPDVHFSVSMTKKDVLVESDALEPRLVEAEQMAKRMGKDAWYARIKIFRRGERQIGNWKGFELVARKPAQDTEGMSHEFAFLSQGEPNNPLLPVLDLKMNSGVDRNTTSARPPSVTDEEAIAIWDSLISTLRVRPTKVGDTIAAIAEAHVSNRNTSKGK